MNKIRKITILFFFLSLILFLFGSLTKLNVPLAEWDRVSLEAAMNWSKGVNKAWIFDHPPLYPMFLSILFKLFSPGVITARLGNILCILLTALLVFRLTSRLFNSDSAFWAVVFYLLSPLSIQGTTSLDVADTSLLPLLFMITLNSIYNNTLIPSLKNIAVLSLSVALCFWAKITSTIALIIPLMVGNIFYALYSTKESDYKPWLSNITGITIGIVIFLITWISLSILLWGRSSSSIVLATPWIAIHSKFKSAANFSSLLTLGLHAFRIILWFSPYFLIIWLVRVLDILKNTPKSPNAEENVKSLFAWTTIFYFGGYLLIGGTNWGFPRYHVALLPLISIFVGEFSSALRFKLENKMFIALIFVSTLLILIITFLLKDPIFFINLRLKELLLKGFSYNVLIISFFREIIPYYGLPLLGVLLLIISLKLHFNNRVLAICLLVGSLTTLISIDIQQILASYRTSNQYGAVGKVQVLQKVSNHISDGDYVFATPEFIYELKNKKVPSVGWKIWQSKNIFCRLTESNSPQAIVAGLTVNTYNQLKWLLSRDTLLFLSRDYDFITIGTYYLWLRTSKRY